MLKTLSLVLLITLAYCAVSAQEIIYEQYETGVDFWVMIPFNTLNFPKGSRAAEYQLSMVIKNSHKKQMVDFEQSIIIPNKEWLKETAIPVRFNESLPPDSYTAEFKLRNKAMGEKRTFKKSFVISPGFTEIGQSWLIAKREGVSYIPYSLADIARQVDELILTLNYSVDLDSIRIQTDNRSMHITNLQNPIRMDMMPLLADWQGSILKLTLYEKNIHYVVEPFLFSPWYSYSLRYSLEDQMTQLRYVASQNEWQVLRSVPASKYLSAIESFWKANDPSPGTVRNENREKFYQRVLRADEMFTVHKKLKGWNSDRGRIYIKYGEPDEIVSESYPLGRYPNIIWTYYKQDREFIFADTKGFGLYTLRNKEDEY
jgi:GWxTD domain-containing protein